MWTTNFVDAHTGRLQRTVTDRETASPHAINDSYYSYDASGTITSNARKLSGATGSVWDNQCFTYDVLGELVNAWTSGIAPTGNGTGCKAANGATWGHRTDAAPSSGPIADAPDAASDADTPDGALAVSLTAAAPDAATVSTGATAYHQSFTFDWLGNRATMTEHNTADATKDVGFVYSYGKTVTGAAPAQTVTTQPHTLSWIGSTPSGQGSSYSYDATGNTEVRDLPADHPVAEVVARQQTGVPDRRRQQDVVHLRRIGQPAAGTLTVGGDTPPRRDRTDHRRHRKDHACLPVLRASRSADRRPHRDQRRHHRPQAPRSDRRPPRHGKHSGRTVRHPAGHPARVQTVRRVPRPEAA